MEKERLGIAGVLVVVVVVVLGVLVVIAVGLIMPKTQIENETNSNEPNVIEFPPLTLCRNTGGEWKAVNASEFPANEAEGVYSPTTNPELNYKCFCPSGKNWNTEEGCK